MTTIRFIAAFALAALLLALAPQRAEAHQPYFEGDDWTPATAYRVADPTVSTALYATLDSRTDVDYVVFTGKAGQRILLGITIPQIDGQEEFAPTIALMGPGLSAAVLPDRVETPDGAGSVILAPAPGPATEFFEPFSRTRYWERQEDRITLPADGEYRVAVWDAAGRAGRYTLVVGDREIPGGDMAFPFKLRTFWTPVPQPPAPAESHQCGGSR